MTAIGHFIEGSRRPGVLGVHSLDSFAITVPDLDVAERFYRSFGLDLSEEANGFGLWAQGSNHKWVSVLEGGKKQLHHLSFGAFEEDISSFQARLKQLGVERLDPPPGLESNGLWFRDPNGALIEIKVAEKTSPTGKTPTTGASAPAGARGAPKRSAVKIVTPKRLAHLLIFARDVEESIRFYSTCWDCGCQTDQATQSLSCTLFTAAITRSSRSLNPKGSASITRAGDVGSIQEIGLGAMQMADKGFSKGWGLGRQVLGSNYFHQVRNPRGSYAEIFLRHGLYSCERRLGRRRP